MKKLIIFALLTGSVTFAQAGEKTSEQVKQEASEIARQMAHTLELNEHEYIKVRALTIEKLTVLNELTGTYANDAAMLERKTAETELAFQKQLVHILNPKQLDSYLSVYGIFQE